MYSAVREILLRALVVTMWHESPLSRVRRNTDLSGIAYAGQAGCADNLRLVQVLPVRGKDWMPELWLQVDSQL